MKNLDSNKRSRVGSLVIALLALAALALSAQVPSATFVNQTEDAIFLKVYLTDDPALCAEGEYLTYELGAGEEVVVEFGEAQSACYCALAVPRDTCEFPETTQPGETVVLEAAQGE